MAVTKAAGFVDLHFREESWDTFAGAPSASSAPAFGTKGVAFQAVKPR